MILRPVRLKLRSSTPRLRLEEVALSQTEVRLRFHSDDESPSERAGQKGQTLLEVLTALAVGVLVLVGMTSVILGSLTNTQFSKNQNLATLYSQQGMEIMRDIRNTSWSTFYNTYTSTSTMTFCLPGGSTTPKAGFCGLVDYVDGVFKREIKFTRDTIDPAGKIQVVTTVSFTDSKGEHKSELISVLTNWNVQ